jgi:tripartite ATP-independent transporter DctP family solute receptor
VDFPFLFNTPQEADAVMDGPVGKALSDQLPEKGLVGLGYWELGFRNLTNSRRPVTKLEDIQGLKIRVLQSPIFIDLFTALGANAVPLPYPELYTAMETGTVDGQENPFSNIISSKFYEVQKNLALTQHVYNPQILLISKKFWDKLNSDEQKVLQDAAIEARDYQRTVSREMSAKALDELKAEGVRITELPPEEVEKLRAKTKPVVEKHSKEVNPALVQQLYAEIDKVRGKN